MTYKITFNYYKPGNTVPNHPDVGITGHMNVTFDEVGVPNQTYGMNTVANNNPLGYLRSGEYVDGRFGIENYGASSHSVTIEVDAATYNALLQQAQTNAGRFQDYNLFQNSCITYANSVYQAAGGQGHLLDQFLPIMDPSDWGLLMLAREPYAAAAGALAFALLTAASPIFGLSLAFFLLDVALIVALRDPFILDLDGDGIELTALGVAGQPDASNIYFDYDRDGFAERTGWVSADDGMLAFDANGNGVVDGISELFGSPSQDGYAVLETFDTNHDGVIDANDREFAKLRVWRDLNQNGITDAGELQTLAEAGIASISLTRSDVSGTNAGHDRGFQGLFTRTNGTTGTAETIYFQTDRRTTQDNTPNFTAAEGVDKLPQLPGSGQIHSIAFKATNDAAFRARWTVRTDKIRRYHA